MMQNFIQRHPVITIAITFSLLGLLGLSLITWQSQRRHRQAYSNEHAVFNQPLAIPALVEPVLENGEQVFTLTAQTGTTEFFPGIQTKTTGYNGSYLGPTLHAHTGDPVRIRFTNQLTDATTLHWHGMEVPASMDGGPHQRVEPGATWEPNWTITNPASTLWYHPHLLNATSTQVYSGLAGLFYVDDDTSAQLDIPNSYGVDDIPLVVQDRLFDDDGQFLYTHNHMMHGKTTAGMLGDTILVNGTYAPYVEVPKKIVRLRLVNGSNARRYYFGFSDDRSFYQIASDGGLLAAPVKLERLLLTPGERAELLVDLSADATPVSLLSYNVEDHAKSQIPDVVQDWLVGETDEDQQFKILELRPTGAATTTVQIPTTLVSIPSLDPNAVTTSRTFSLEASTINGKSMDHGRVDEIVQTGSTEIWEIKNQSAIFHPFHIHGVQFQILERDGSTPPANEQGWKDTVNVDPGKSVKLIMKFNMAADPTLPFMFHCHILEHEDMGMMGQFVVVPDANTAAQLNSTLNDTTSMFSEHMHGMQH